MRRTLKDIPYYPDPKEIYDAIMASPGWPYRNKNPRLIARDRALVALLYLTGLRVSEALRLTKRQFTEHEGYILIRSIKLSKSHVEGKPRRVQYRDARLPLTGERAPLTALVTEYLSMLGEDERLFPWSLAKNRWGQIAGGKRAWQVVKAYLPDHTCHWLRAYCENYLYDMWGRDLLAVADYVKVDPRTLEQYIRRRHELYPAV